MQFDRQKFFTDYNGRFGKATETQKRGLDFLLRKLESDERITMIRELAYVLATVKGEAGNFQPIKEKRANPKKQAALFKIQQKYWPTGFFGRGYVQLTHKANYRSAGSKLAGTIVKLRGNDNTERTITVDAETFVKEPNLVMQPEVAYLILSRGMTEGWFRKNKKTGAPYKLSTFISQGKPPNYLGARNIINHPSSSADKFAGFAEKFELILRASNTEDNT